MTKHSLVNFLLVLWCLALSSARGAQPSPGAPFAPECARSGAGALPLAGAMDEWRYTLTARVRLLVFWINREDVGGARIASARDADGGRALELLIGSDPARAPMRVNRWGYVAERRAGTSAELLGIMTAADEQSIEQAKAGITQPGATHLFKAIRGGVDGRVAHSVVTRMPLKEDFTFRDLHALICMLPEGVTPAKTRVIPEGTEPGFLFAVKSMLDESVAAYRQMGGTVAPTKSRRTYVYDACLFELTRTSSRGLPETRVNGRTYKDAIESDFEARNLSTGKINSFSILYSTTGPAAGMPVRIVYRPRWWFEAELRLDAGPVTQQASAGGVPCKAGSR